MSKSTFSTFRLAGEEGDLAASWLRKELVCLGFETLPQPSEHRRGPPRILLAMNGAKKPRVDRLPRMAALCLTFLSLFLSRKRLRWRSIGAFRVGTTSLLMRSGGRSQRELLSALGLSARGPASA